MSSHRQQQWRSVVKKMSVVAVSVASTFFVASLVLAGEAVPAKVQKVADTKAAAEAAPAEMKKEGAAEVKEVKEKGKKHHKKKKEAMEKKAEEAGKAETPK